MPRYDISPRERKLRELGALGEIGASGQKTDMDTLSALMQQMLQMYNLQQDQQFAPEKLRALQTSTDAAAYGLESDKAMNPLKMEQAKAQTGLLTARAAQEGRPDPRDLSYLYPMGNAPAAIRDTYLTPEARASEQAAANAEAQRRQQLMAQDQAMQQQTVPAAPSEVHPVLKELFNMFTSAPGIGAAKEAFTYLKPKKKVTK